MALNFNHFIALGNEHLSLLQCRGAKWSKIWHFNIFSFFQLSIHPDFNLCMQVNSGCMQIHQRILTLSKPENRLYRYDIRLMLTLRAHNGPFHRVMTAPWILHAKWPTPGTAGRNGYSSYSTGVSGIMTAAAVMILSWKKKEIMKISARL
ncbi:MAG: hypothetical protein AB2L14_26155 [Candidatus Xenobiia bacterium LiM19]